jgi:CheY-like chemotaxis protein
MMAIRKRQLAAILLVDDEPAVREVQRRVLETEGYVVTDAGSGLEGIAALSQPAQVDLLLADLDMPGLGGDEMVRQIRSSVWRVFGKPCGSCSMAGDSH